MDPELQAQIDERVAKTLASMGGDLLSTYGNPEHDTHQPILASLGGYLLERFGDHA